MRTSLRFKACAVGISALFLGGAAIDAGCGSDSFTPSASTDAGVGDEAGDAGSAEAEVSDAAGCVVAPSGVPAADVAFCNAFAAISSRCGACEDCRKENAESCATFGDQLSTAARNAIVACADEIGCTEFEQQTPFVQDTCILGYLFDAGPTPAQVGAKDAYCSHCADAGGNGGENCTSYFGELDGSAGIGAFVLFSNDEIANAIATGCRSCDGLTYPFLCEYPAFCKGVPKDVCATGVCK